MGPETGLIVAGAVAAGIAIGAATGVIDFGSEDTLPPTQQQAAPEQAAPPAPAAEAPVNQAAVPPPAPAPAEPPAPAPVAAPAPAPAPAPPAPPAPAAIEQAPQPACPPVVDIKGGYVIDMKADNGNCRKSGKVRHIMSIECTEGPPGWIHKYYLDDKRQPVFVTKCMPPPPLPR